MQASRQPDTNTALVIVDVPHGAEFHPALAIPADATVVRKGVHAGIEAGDMLVVSVKGGTQG